MEYDSELERLKQEAVDAVIGCGDSLLLDLVCKIIISDGA